MKPRLAVARKKARSLLNRADVQSAPVPVHDLARAVGAVVRLEPTTGEQISGMLYQPPSGPPIIGVNSLDSPRRQRFTIAHEIGHLLLHPPEEIHVDKGFVLAFRDDTSGNAVDYREIEANQFAAELLMPLSFLGSDVRRMQIDIESSDDDDIERLAARYEVSVRSMTIRLSVLARFS